MGNQRSVVIGQDQDEVGGPIAEHHGKSKEKGKSLPRRQAGKKEKVEEKIKEKKFEKEPEKSEETSEQDEKASAPLEKQEAKSADLPAAFRHAALAKAGAKGGGRIGKAKIRSKKYQQIIKLIDRAKKYDVAEAIDLVKKTSLTKFDGNVEIHARLLNKAGKPENIRGLLKYPHSTGKSINVVVLDEKVAADIEKTGKAKADIYIATPVMMPKIAKLAKILGPKGKMPNPKSGTITDNPEKTKKELEGGQVEYKTDSFGNIHQVIGKVSADKKILEENFRALLAALPSDRITGISICATMGPGIKVQI